jgi:FkbM family methyltransferase
MTDLEDIVRRLDALKTSVDAMQAIVGDLDRRARRGPFYEPHNGRLWIHTVDNQRMYVDPRESFMTMHLIEHGEWEPHVRTTLRRLLRPGDTFVDIGANIGLHALLACQLVGGNGKVLAIEPAPATRDLLAGNIEINGQGSVARIIPVVVGDRDRARVTFGYHPAHPGMSGMAVENYRHADARGPAELVDVEMRTLDSLGAEHGIDSAVIKIDVEDFEPAVMDGAKGLVASRDVAFVIESSPPHPVMTFFRTQGYRVYLAEEPQARPLGWDDATSGPGGDYIFVRAGSRFVSLLT